MNATVPIASFYSFRTHSHSCLPTSQAKSRLCTIWYISLNQHKLGLLSGQIRYRINNVIDESFWEDPLPN